MCVGGAVVGLTGGIATGKSTVSKLVGEAGIPIIDADVLARKVVEPGTRTLKRIVAEFGEDILLGDGQLDRKKLGGIIFGDEGKRRALNGIVHPAVRWEMLVGVVKCWIRGHRVCVLDVPLLIEGGLWKWVGKVAVVSCPREVQLQRLMARDSSTEAEALARLNSQLSIEEKVGYADYVVDNSGEMAELQGQVSRFVREIIPPSINEQGLDR
ncbi:CoaE-domain-containing protein [Pleurotus eryngii]|uniref:CoaE-domain-containing protein n=1 Tax=Pleurotus eryngii TaxID=5323 RepID=A0A9P5ZJF2_PLEER|nr:CoaE-domain-containing protein [Pleurotus eryngii]